MVVIRVLTAMFMLAACKGGSADDSATDSGPGTTTAGMTGTTTGAPDPTSTSSTSGAEPTGTSSTSGATDSTSAPTESSETTSGACEVPQLGVDCCCFEPSDMGLVVYCMPELYCDSLNGTCKDEQGLDCDIEEAAAAAIDCNIAALQSGTQWYFNWDMKPAEPQLGWEYYINVYNAGDGSMYWVGVLADSDMSYHYLGVYRFDLASLDLDACAGLASADERFDCLRAAFAAAPTIETCVEPFM